MNILTKSVMCTILTATIISSLCACNQGQNSINSQTTAETNETTALVTEKVTSTQDTVEPTTQQPTYSYDDIKLDSDRIKTDFDRIIVTNKFRGAIYAKIGNDFEFIGSNGYSDKIKHTENSINTGYRIGSLTKQFTAAAIMLLQEDGKLSVNDSIKKYFPSYKYADKITIKNLLTMTSGIPDYMNEDGYVDYAVYFENELGYKVSSKNSASENHNSIQKWILSQKLLFEPDEKYQFSNSNYYLLGDIIAKVSKTSYEKFIQKNIFDALDMDSTSFKADDDLATGYQDIFDKDWTLYPGVAYSSSGMISNVSDLLKWVDALTGVSLLSRDSLNEMFTPYKGNYGYGFFIHDDEISHNGSIDKYNAGISFNSDESQICIALSNYTQSSPEKIVRKLREYLSQYLG